jgi:ATP-binding cassette subfamily B protein
VTGGELSIDGLDVRSLDRDALWAKIGLIPPEGLPVTGTIASNLRFGKADATDDELWSAPPHRPGRGLRARARWRARGAGQPGWARTSRADSASGSRSRGALVKRPEIYVFDDSFSALDFKTDAALRAALASEIADATVVIVAQRVGTIMGADRIVVLDAGTIVGIGTHHELMATCETYREIVYSQISAEEAA